MLFLLIILLPAASPAQAPLVLGQYQDEVPLRTWNIFGPLTASQTAMGGTRYARAFDLSASQTNPSLLSRLPQFTAVLSGSYVNAELFRYGPVNTGILSSAENIAHDSTLLDFGGVAVNYKGWGLAFTVSINELFERPPSGASIIELGFPVYTFAFAQDGYIRTFNLGLARQITPRLSVGIGLNHESGWLERASVEEMIYNGVTIEDTKRLTLESYFLNAGVTFNASDTITLAAVVRTPYTRKAEGNSSVSNSTPPLTDIRIEVEAESTYKQPLIVGVGADFALTEKIHWAADASFYNWASYQAIYFGEKLDRCLKNVVTLHTGLEYAEAFQMFKQDFRLPLWLGFAYDPQPVACVDSTYTYVTGGLGLRHRYFHLEVGGMLGWEHGSGDDLKVYRVTATAGFRY
ncbi:MAG: hypothetical protein WBB73_05730 [Candidatus Aminicenantaceae bacterium]